MYKQIQEQLLKLNQTFYQEFADPFARSRGNPQPGFQQLISHIPAKCARALDVGCGEGRFGRFLLSVRPDINYVGVDFSEELLGHAGQSVPDGVFLQRNVSNAGSLGDLGTFGLVAILAVLQHIPGRQSRIRLLAELGQRLDGKGRLIVSTWQFMDSARQRRKITGWHAAGIPTGAVEENDYLMTWRAGGEGLRYVAYIDRSEMDFLALHAGLTVVDSFRSDGLEGDLNLYTVLAQRRKGQSHSS